MDLGLANVAQAASLELLGLSPKVHLGFAYGATATVLLVTESVPWVLPGAC